MDAGPACLNSPPPLPAVRRAPPFSPGGAVLLGAWLARGSAFLRHALGRNGQKCTVDVSAGAPAPRGLTRCTDLHLSPDVTAAYLQRVVEQVNAIPTSSCLLGT